MRTKIITFFITVVTMLSILGTSAFADSLPKIDSLEAPQNVTVEVKELEDGKPYFEVKWSNPQSIKEQYVISDELGEAPLGYQIDMKVGDGKWNYDLIGDTIPGNSLHSGEIINFAPYDPVNAGELDTVDIKTNVYHFRVRYSYLNSNDADEYYTYSPFSNIASTGIEAFYKGASSWAVKELDKAAEYGLITDAMKNEMNAPITREEFAELATRLYEVYKGEKAEVAPASTFTDTTNAGVLKANKLGIVMGVGNNKFDPKALTNREQISAMLNRAVKIINPDTELSSQDAPTFADESEIEPYFVENVKVMAKHGFISGVGGNRFDPKAQCTREQAVLIAVRVYEAYKK